MKTWQLIKHMEEGGKIRHEHLDSVFSMDIFRTLMEDEELTEIELIFIDPESFEFYIEPKKTKLVNVLAYRHTSGEIFIVLENSRITKHYNTSPLYKRLPSLDQKDKEIEDE